MAFMVFDWKRIYPKIAIVTAAISGLFLFTMINCITKCVGVVRFCILRGAHSLRTISTLKLITQWHCSMFIDTKKYNDIESKSGKITTKIGWNSAKINCSTFLLLPLCVFTFVIAFFSGMVFHCFWISYTVYSVWYLFLWLWIFVSYRCHFEVLMRIFKMVNSQMKQKKNIYIDKSKQQIKGDDEKRHSK